MMGVARQRRSLNPMLTARTSHGGVVVEHRDGGKDAAGCVHVVESRLCSVARHYGSTITRQCSEVVDG